MHPAAMQRRHVFRLGIGTDGGTGRGYKRGGYGGLEAHRIDKTSVFSVGVNTGEAFALNVGGAGNEQIADMTAVIVKFPGFSSASFSATWDGSGYTGTGPAGLLAWLTPQLNRNCKLVMRSDVPPVLQALDLARVVAFLIAEGWASAAVSGDVLSVPSQGASWTRAELEAGDYNGVLPPLLNDLIDALAEQGYGT